MIVCHKLPIISCHVCTVEDPISKVFAIHQCDTSMATNNHHNKVENAVNDMSNSTDWFAQLFFFQAQEAQKSTHASRTVLLPARLSALRMKKQDRVSPAQHTSREKR